MWQTGVYLQGVYAPWTFDILLTAEVTCWDGFSFFPFRHFLYFSSLKIFWSSERKNDLQCRTGQISRHNGPWFWNHHMQPHVPTPDAQVGIWGASSLGCQLKEVGREGTAAVAASQCRRLIIQTLSIKVFGHSGLHSPHPKEHLICPSTCTDSLLGERGFQGPLIQKSFINVAGQKPAITSLQAGWAPFPSDRLQFCLGRGSLQSWGQVTDIVTIPVPTSRRGLGLQQREP